MLLFFGGAKRGKEGGLEKKNPTTTTTMMMSTQTSNPSPNVFDAPDPVVSVLLTRWRRSRDRGSSSGDRGSTKHGLFLVERAVEDSPRRGGGERKRGRLLRRGSKKDVSDRLWTFFNLFALL